MPLSSAKRSTSPKERIIPIKIEDRERRYSSDSSVDDSKRARPMKDNKSNKKANNKSIDSKKKSNETIQWKKNDKKDKSKSEHVTRVDINANVVKDSKSLTKNKKDAKLKEKEKDKKTSKKDTKNTKDSKDSKSAKKIESTEERNSSPESEPEDGGGGGYTVVTTQPGKSILKHPVASSTPIPEAETHDSSTGWSAHNRSSSSSGGHTVVHKPTSSKSKCKSWCCLPLGLCCICAPFECECCDCCYLKCNRCEQCFCQCCNRKCC